MKHSVLLAILFALLTLTAGARTRTTQANLRTASIILEPIPVTLPADSIAVATVDQNAVTLRGFNKRLRDAKETFLVTNNTSHRISGIRITLRYTTLGGDMIHERNVAVPIVLNPGETQLADIKTFDLQHLFYYYAGPAPRKSSTPFQVAYRLIGYDIPVGY